VVTHIANDHHLDVVSAPLPTEKGRDFQAHFILLGRTRGFKPRRWRRFHAR
jgi:hypothetical protein